jgi:hypothetical protein
MRARLAALVAIVSLVLLAQCSENNDAANRYGLLKQYQEASETLINTSRDYELRISTCGQVVDSLDVFLSAYQESELVSIATVERDTWKVRQTQLQNEYDELLQKVSAATMAAARKAAQGRHGLCDIDQITLTARKTEKGGNDLLANDEYAVRMHDRFSGTNIYKLNIFVVGRLNTANGAVSVVDSDVRVVE